MRDKNLNSKLKNNFGAKANDSRIYIFLVIVFVIIAAIYPAFFTSGSIKALVSTSLIYIIVGVGFTYVMIGGNFDLSIGSIINAGAVVTMGEFNRFYKIFGGVEGGDSALIKAWILAFACAIGVGLLIGFVNGFLVAKVKVHSFIVTIGMLTTVAGFVYTYSHGNSISANTYSLVDVIDKSFVKIPYLEVFTPRFVIAIILVVVFEFILLKTKWGYDLFMVGSNKESSFFAGINTVKKVWITFIISGFTAALGGSLFAVSMNAAVPNFGERGIAPLMFVLAATIIGGTAMLGGSGSVVKTAVATIVIQSIFSFLISMGMGFDAQVLAAGVVLGAVVFFESFSVYRQGLKEGERPALVLEAEQLRLKK
ncbi:ribose ABC transporter permease [Clostridia bacterium]|nr:ribose ABC transporter permease [Clostridia bacterium]